jgi:simple sugar transport system permease protein
MAVEEQQQAPLAEREPARKDRGARGAWPAMRGLLIGRPETGALFGAIVMFVFFALYPESSDTFTTRSSLADIASITAELAIVAMGVTLLMIAGHFDLSVGSVLGVSSVIAPYFILNYDVNPVLAVLVSIAAAISIGFLNGILVVATRIPSFIVTLGTLLIWRSILLRITGGFPVQVERDTTIFKIFSYRIESGFFEGYQVSFLWFLAVLILLSFLLLRTPFGNWSFGAGGNERAARSMGVPVDRVWIILFITTALCACLTGLIQVGRFNTVEGTRGVGLELQAIAAAVIGGARLNGGYGSVLGAALGAAMIAMISVGIVQAGIASYWLNFAVGALIILAVIANQTLGRSRPQI